jgi:hypothetical protein
MIAKGSDASAVFSGEVLDVQEGDRVTLRVSEVWKGPQQETLEVRTQTDPALCGYPFKEGQEYLVYAHGKEEPFNTHVCSETRLLSKANAHLRVLGEGWSSGNDSALSDTSGGIPRLDIFGMLGLAVAAVSLGVLMRLVRTG